MHQKRTFRCLYHSKVSILRFRFVTSLLTALLLSLAMAATPAAAQEDGTFIVNLMTCDVAGSVDSFEIVAEFDSAASDYECREGWDINAGFTLDGVGPDGGDGVTSLVWTGLDTGLTYDVVDEEGIGFFEGYELSFLEGATSVEATAVHYDTFTPAPDGEGDGDTDDSVTDLPDTGTGVSTPDSAVGLAMVVAAALAGAGVVTRRVASR